MFEKFTDHARKVMALANQEAQRFNHEYIGTEHILLGLVKDSGCKAAILLRDFQIDLRTVRLEVEKRVKAGSDMFVMGKLPQTPDAKSLILKSLEVARAREDGLVDTQHLLLAMLSLPDTIAYDSLRSLCDVGTLFATLTDRMDALRTTPDETGAIPALVIQPPAPHQPRVSDLPRRRPACRPPPRCADARADRPMPE